MFLCCTARSFKLRGENEFVECVFALKLYFARVVDKLSDKACQRKTNLAMRRRPSYWGHFGNTTLFKKRRRAFCQQNVLQRVEWFTALISNSRNARLQTAQQYDRFQPILATNAALCNGVKHCSNRVGAIRAWCALYKYHISMLVFHQSNRVNAVQRMLFYYRRISKFCSFMYLCAPCYCHACLKLGLH